MEVIVIYSEQEKIHVPEETLGGHIAANIGRVNASSHTLLVYINLFIFSPHTPHLRSIL